MELADPLLCCAPEAPHPDLGTLYQGPGSPRDLSLNVEKNSPVVSCVLRWLPDPFQLLPPDALTSCSQLELFSGSQPEGHHQTLATD